MALAMDSVILILILNVLIIKCDAGQLNAKDNPHIIFTSLSSNKQQQSYTVVANKPLHLHFQNMSRGWCYNYYRHSNTLEKSNPPKIENSTIPANHCSFQVCLEEIAESDMAAHCLFNQFPDVTHDMSTLWKCKVMENKTGDSNKILIKGKYHIFLFNLHVKGAKSVQLTVNEKELAFSVADLAAPYDGDTIHFYEDGDHVQVVCRNPHSTGSVHLEYFTKDATNISDSATLFIQLHSGSNSSYIDCVYNTTEPDDVYVYRVTFVIKKRLSYLNESNKLSGVQTVHISTNQGKVSVSSSPILGSCIGAVLIILGLTGAACWYVRTRNAKHAKCFVDLCNHYDSPTSQCTQECENQYDVCHYREDLSSGETYYDIPESVQNIDLEEHYYTKVDYLSCKPKIDETQTRNSEVYDEPYVQITMTDGMQESQRV